MAKRSKKTGGAVKERRQNSLEIPAPTVPTKSETVDVGTDEISIAEGREFNPERLTDPVSEPSSQQAKKHFVAEGRSISCIGGIFNSVMSRNRGGITADDVIGGTATIEDLVRRNLLVEE